MINNMSDNERTRSNSPEPVRSVQISPNNNRWISTQSHCKLLAKAIRKFQNNTVEYIIYKQLQEASALKRTSTIDNKNLNNSINQLKEADKINQQKIEQSQNNITKLHNPGATAFGVRLIDEFLKGK